MIHFVKERFFSLGSPCSLQIEDENLLSARIAMASALEEVQRIEAKYSRYREDSLLSAINRCGLVGGSLEIDPETEALLDYAAACTAMSDGLFDITSGVLRKIWNFKTGLVPTSEQIASILPHIGLDRLHWGNGRCTLKAGTEIDLGGIGKEYAVDRIADIWRDLEITSGLIELGGDIRCVGARADGSAWTVAIEDPTSQNQSLLHVQLSNESMATSGSYRQYIEIDGVRYCHILNPKTGWPVHGISSVSVVSENCTSAGSLSTLAMLKGVEGSAWLAARAVRHLIVTSDNEILNVGLTG